MLAEVFEAAARGCGRVGDPAMRVLSRLMDACGRLST
jgi:hypothetical protein